MNKQRSVSAGSRAVDELLDSGEGEQIIIGFADDAGERQRHTAGLRPARLRGRRRQAYARSRRRFLRAKVRIDRNTCEAGSGI
jgi:hypothetical protein